MNFASDNRTGVHPRVMAAIESANRGCGDAYSQDQITHRARELIDDFFGCETRSFFVATGTASNSLALSALCKPWQSIVCHSHAHIFQDECTAPEFFTGGSRLEPIDDDTGLLTAAQLRDYLQGTPREVPHHNQPGVVSLTQLSEAGRRYSLSDLAEIGQMCREQQLFLHIDGARFANAVATGDDSPGELSWKQGVDAISLGATKCGAMCAEAVVFFNPEMGDEFLTRQKRAGQLFSKSRFIAAQFVAWLEDGLWRELASQANAAAARLARGLATIDQVIQVWSQEGNQLFVVLPETKAALLIEQGVQFYEWYPQLLPAGIDCDPTRHFIRLVTSCDTTQDEVDRLIDLLS